MIADELARDAEQYGASAGRNEHDGSRVAIDELLQIAAGRQRLAAVPAADSLAPAGRERLDEPIVDGPAKPDPTSSCSVSTGVCPASGHPSVCRRVRLQPDPWRRKTALPKHFGEEHGIAHAADDLRRVAPQRTAFGERLHGVRMILEVCEVHHRVAFDTAGRRGPPRAP